MTGLLRDRVVASLSAPVAPQVSALAGRLADEAGALAVLFYGSNLRTGSLEGVLDYYLLMPGEPEAGVWPRVSYHEVAEGGLWLRAKVATVTLARFRQAAAGELIDTTIWARFVQPSALIWTRDDASRQAAIEAVAAATVTAARLAAALGPDRGAAEEYWRALFRATYQAEFRVERPGREDSILAANPAHFDGLLPLALNAAGIDFDGDGVTIIPSLAPAERKSILRWWRKRRRWGKPLNLIRLVRATTTFKGAARYAAWKIERHTGVAIKLTPWRERHPILAAPGVLWSVWRRRRQG